MLSITRALAHRLHTVFRRVLHPGGGAARLPVVFQADSSGLSIRCEVSEIAVAYHEPGSFSSEMIVLPLEALKVCAGRDPAPVWIEETSPEQVRVQWDMEGFTRTQEFEAVAADDLPSFPATPASFDSAPAGFLAAFHEAAQTAANVGRWALNRVQLRGGAGEVIGSDGKQLFLASGFGALAPADVLVPSLTVFDNRLLRNDGPAEVGFTDTRLCLRLLPEGSLAGGWQFSLRLDREGRYPDVAALLASLAAPTTRWLLGPGEAALLQKELPRLPKAADNTARLEVDLGETVVLQGGLGWAKPGEAQIVLPRSQVIGEPLRFATNPLYLWRAVCLGFTEVQAQGAKQPLLCADESRKYAWMPLV
jgi:hypothetical protein